MKVLRNILESEKTNLGKLEIIELLDDAIVLYGESMKVAPSIETANNIFILGNILDVIKTKSTWGKNQLKDLFLDKILGY
jgi:hypothetical protein